VYVLTSFIEAHEHAQKKIHSFVCSEALVEELDLTSEQTSGHSPEELEVIKESRIAVFVD
jgi:hypothetical protein